MTKCVVVGIAISVFSLVVFAKISRGQDDPVAEQTPISAQSVGRENTVGALRGLSSPPLGMGLNGIVDWSSEQPFIDIMKTARPWTGHLPHQWGGWNLEDFASRGYLDKDGWLTSIPKDLEGVSTLILTDLPPEAVSVNGRYRMTYKGQGAMRIEGRARHVRREGDAIWFEAVAGPGNLVITITSTDPHGTGDYIRDIEIVKEENIPLHEVGAKFNPDWIKRIEDLRVLRFMEWMGTNDSTASEWSERPQVNDYTYAQIGAPVEIMVALANQIGADPWFTLPHMATDEYMRRFAEYVRDNLDPTLKAHVEYSNEVWNWQFQQAHWAEAQALKRWKQDSKWVEFYGMRAAQMAQIWDEVFGEQVDDRLVKIISTQTGWIGLEEAVLTTPLWVAEDPARNRPAASYFDSYAVTGYFAGSLGNDSKAPIVKKWIEDSRAAAVAGSERQNLTGTARDAYVEEHAYDGAVALAARELRDGSVTGDKQDTVGELIATIFSYHREVARKHGLDLIMYEGGTHVVALGAWVDDPVLTPFFIHLNYTAEMGALYQTLLEGWKGAGGTLFNAFVDVSAPSKWGSWGALRHLSDENPRWDALAAFNGGTPGWWESRHPETFLHGVTIRAAPGEKRIEGTTKADILIGSNGDDLLVGGGGSDRLNGGSGDDAAVLPGHSSNYVFDRQGEMLTATAGHAVTTLYSVETLLFSDEPDRRLPTVELR
ncbi:hypothetical protein LHFGNBLO_001695 [Mesorhizobium sp. AR10]|uniref:hypothetical protein n=1 Tax=Mesorhizobium sp. AR10 TaxID=2865839 RepID=UPI00215F7494|nr:hypothetical protein [Mesorhizobium sp. AR10]UVK40248.1 hypothetical protein LHFGNBLO_001695 [Mesorhizobium sp. AR10]